MESDFPSPVVYSFLFSKKKKIVFKEKKDE